MLYIFYLIANGNCTHVLANIRPGSSRIRGMFEPSQLLTTQLKMLQLYQVIIALDVRQQCCQTAIKWFGAEPMRCLALTHFHALFASHKFHCTIHLINWTVMPPPLPFGWQLAGRCARHAERVSAEALTYASTHICNALISKECPTSSALCRRSRAFRLFKCLHEHWSIFILGCYAQPILEEYVYFKSKSCPHSTFPVLNNSSP